MQKVAGRIALAATDPATATTGTIIGDEGLAPCDENPMLGSRLDDPPLLSERREHARPQPGRMPIISPRRTGRSGVHTALKAMVSRRNSITIVEPSRKRPISSPFFSTML